MLMIGRSQLLCVVFLFGKDVVTSPNSLSTSGDSSRILGGQWEWCSVDQKLEVVETMHGLP